MARARRRTKSGRFTKRRTTRTKRRTYSVRRRSNPRSSYYYPKKGQRRLAPQRARRAYTKSRRRNKTGVMDTPAIQYSIAAGVGVIAAAWADTAEFLNPVNKETGQPSLPFGLKGSVLAAGITFALAQWGLKGKNKSYARAAGVGMLVPSVANMVQMAMTKNGNGNGNGQVAVGNGGASGWTSRRRLTSPRNRHSAAAFTTASRNLDNAA